jgi:hypothetical protein
MQAASAKRRQGPGVPAGQRRQRIAAHRRKTSVPSQVRLALKLLDAASELLDPQLLLALEATHVLRSATISQTGDEVKARQRMRTSTWPAVTRR